MKKDTKATQLDWESIDRTRPTISAQDMERAEDLFHCYVFYTSTPKGDRTLWTSCCHKDGITYERNQRTEPPAHAVFLRATHNETVVCPYCGKTATLKNVGKSKSRKKLLEYQNIGFLHCVNGAVYIQSYYAYKDYEASLLPCVTLQPKAIAYFKKGTAAQFKHCHDWTGLGMTPAGKRRAGQWEQTKTVYDPFPGGMGYYTMLNGGMQIIGIERLAQSELAYSGYLDYENGGQCTTDGYVHDVIIRYLAAYTQRPQLEMMVKMKLRDMVCDLVIQRRKGKGIHWEETDPRKAFGVNGRELATMAELNITFAELRGYRKLKQAGMRMEFSAVRELGKMFSFPVDTIVDLCTTGCGVSTSKLIAYLRKQSGSQSIKSEVLILWKDYIGAAKYCGYDLNDLQVLLPKQLKAAHDGATQTENQLRHENEVTDNSGYGARRQALEKRYGFQCGDYFIRPPSASREIVAEGNILGHCVGRYAGGHARGTTTILFMRRNSQPFTPMMTIEMNGNTMMQIQGKSKTDRVPKGEVKQVLDQWLLWVSGGSKRDKQGNPRLPKSKQNASIA